MTRELAQEELAALSAQFRDGEEFSGSPLYAVLSATAARHPEILRTAAAGPPGQHPTFLLLGAVHHLLLAGVQHPLRRYYASLVGGDALPPEGSASAFVDFCRTYEPELTHTVARRLVQTNSVTRALALWLGLATVRSLTPDPVHLLEVGASAGLNLLLDQYSYRLGGRTFGAAHAAVTIRSELRGGDLPAQVDRIPVIASRRGLDLHPLDLRDDDDRRWLRALVWPDHAGRRDLLEAAMGLWLAAPPAVEAVDVTDLGAVDALALPDAGVRVVFHSATRMHVPLHLREAFDEGVARIAGRGAGFVITMESAVTGQPATLRVRAPDGSEQLVATVDGHLRWVRL